jgi:hypothetical protein
MEERKETVMSILSKRNTGIAAFAALVIVGLTGVTLERGHAGTAPRGVVEVGALETLAVGNLVIAQLPAVDVLGRREVQLADAKAHVQPQG